MKSNEVNFDPQAAIKELGETAQLTFKGPSGEVLLNGSHVKESSPGFNKEIGGYVVQLTFDEEGSRLFAEATERLVGKQIGIFMDDEMISCPVVNQKITGGQCVIEGMAGADEAKSLSEKINAGALPFSMDTTNYSTISPSLGNGALRIMVIAGGVAFALVCGFMIIVYRLPGVASCIALCMQIALQLLVISVPQVTLTLPGIAGIILSLGMAVDANVIISERISEEIAKGLSIRMAIKKGYDKAFSSVFDGNFTSAIVAILLMIFGSGSMLSFGYTLLTGLVINFIAGIFVSKHLLMSVITYKAFNKNKLFVTKKEKKVIPFFEKKQIAFTFSVILLVIGIMTSLIGGIKLDTQFAGGTVLKYTYQGNPSLEEVEQDIEQAIDRSVTLQVAADPISQQKKMEVTLAGTAGISVEDQQRVLETINKGEDQFKLAESYAVEPYIGKSALCKATLAIGLSFIFIILYVWFRFKSMSISAGVMAVIALIHDIFLVLFVFVWFKIPLNDAYVAVTLTIIGYSINDTIVLYDRIRENQTTCSKQTLGELLSLSITQTLSRSINTSLTTIMCVLSLLIFAVLYGISSIKVFALPMLFGLISGCYSSVCIAGPLWGMWKEAKHQRKLLKL